MQNLLREAVLPDQNAAARVLDEALSIIAAEVRTIEKTLPRTGEFADKRYRIRVALRIVLTDTPGLLRIAGV